MLGLYFGSEGYGLYRSMHLNSYNAFVHGLFMPLLGVGVYQGIPALFCSSSTDAKLYSLLIILIYVSYYASFDVVGSLLVANIYGPLTFVSYPKYINPIGRYDVLKRSFLSILVSLVVQEVVGHLLFEGNSSDLRLTLTSITMAPLFGARSLFGVQ